MSLVADLQEEGREVALKSFRPVSTGGDELDLFKHEFLLLSSLHHPNVAEVHDFGVIEGTDDFFFTTEFVDGRDLWEASAEFGWSDWYEVIAQICRGLGYIHSRLLVHHDVKPSNIMVRRDGEDWQAKIIDFGLAESVRDGALGSLRGTVSYIAPEYGRSAPIDRRADLYSLGVTLYHCVTRTLPFQGETNLQVLRAHLKTPPRDPREHIEDLPEPFAALILRLMAKEPSERYGSAEEVIHDLSRLAGRTFEVETTASAVSYVNSGQFVGRGRAFHSLRTTFQEVFGSDGAEDGPSPEISDIFPIPVLREEEEEAAESRGCRLVLVSGEGGIGKSRLLREFKHHVQLRRVAVVEGRAEAASVSYEPFTEALRSLLGLWGGGDAGRADSLRRRLVRRHGAELSKIVPELSSETMGASPVALTPRRERLRLFDHMTRFLMDFARARPLVVFLHDLQHADEASAAALEYLARNLELARRRGHSEGGQVRLLVVASLRETEAEQSGIGPMVHKLEERGEARLLRLTRLNRDSTGDLLDSMLGLKSYPPELVDRIYGETRGNPFFVVETMRSLVERGALTYAGGRWRFDESYEALQLPTTIRDVILERIARLQDDELEPLRLLATWGRPIAAHRFAELSAQAVEPVFGLFEQLVRKQILDRERRGEEHEYFFVHDLMEEAIYADGSEALRVELHRKCGQFLERRHPELALNQPGELARHFELGGDGTKALNYYVKSADAAHLVHANERAIEDYRRALRLIPDTGDPRRQHLLERMGAVQSLVGDYAGALESFKRVLDDCGEIAPLTRARLFRRLGEVEERRGDYEAALQSFSRGMRALGKDVRSQEGAKLLAATGSIYIKKGLYDVAIDFCESGLELLSGFPEEEETAAIRQILGEARSRKGDLRDAAREFELSLELRRRARNRIGIAQTLVNLGAVAMELGHTEEAVSRFEQALTLHETLGHRQGVAEAATHLGRALGVRGESERAVLLHRRALTIQERIGDVEGLVITENDLGGLMLELADYSGARGHFERAFAQNRSLGEVRESVRALNGKAELLYLCGRLEGCSEAAGEALRLATVHELSREQGRAYRFLGLTARDEGDPDRAERLLHRGLTVFSRTEGGPDIALVSLDIVDLFTERGDAELAAMALDKLEEELEGLGRRHLRCRAELARGQVEAARDELDAALARTRDTLAELRGGAGGEELLWWGCLLYGRLLEAADKKPEALAASIEGMEVVKSIYSGLDTDLQAGYLELPRRKALREMFVRLRSEL